MNKIKIILSIIFLINFSFSESDLLRSKYLTDEMINEAKKGLEWRKEFNRGGTDVGVGTAEAIINKSITLDRVKRMYSYFSRHEVDKKAEGFKYSDICYQCDINNIEFSVKRGSYSPF